MKIIIPLLFPLFFSSLLIAQNEYSYELFGEGIGFTEGFNSIETTDKGALLIGSKGHQDLADAQNPWVIKLDENGEHVWEVEVDFAGEGWWDFGIDATEVEDGYVILGNYLNLDDFLSRTSFIKLDFEGNVLWTNDLGGTIDIGYSAITAAEGSTFFVSGDIDNMIALSKFDDLGNELWRTVFTGPTNAASQWMGDMMIMADGNVLLTHSTDGTAILIKADPDGNLLWSTEMIGGAGMSVKEMENGALVALSSVYSDGDFIAEDYLIHLEGDGTIISESLISDEIIENTRDMTIDAEGHVYISGMNTSPLNEAVVIKTNLLADTLWKRSFASELTSLAGLSFDGITLTGDGELLLSGAGWVPIANNNITPAYFYFVRMTLEGFVSGLFAPLPKTENPFLVYPMPANEAVHFSAKATGVNTGFIQLFNSKGQQVLSQPFEQSTFTVERNNMASGLYFYHMFTPSGTWLGSGEVVFE